MLCRDGILTAEALAHAVAPYLQLLGADSERRRLQGLALRTLGPALDRSPVGGALPSARLGARLRRRDHESRSRASMLLLHVNALIQGLPCVHSTHHVSLPYCGVRRH